MSYITFDYQCNVCGAREERTVRRSEMDEQHCIAELDGGLLGIYDCDKPMVRLMAAPITTFKFHDRAAIKSKKAVSLRDPHGNAKSKDWVGSV